MGTKKLKQEHETKVCPRCRKARLAVGFGRTDTNRQLVCEDCLYKAIHESSR